MKKTVVNLICALHCEAKPFIEKLCLKKDLSCHAFQVYKNRDQSIVLIISGIGAINAASACGFIAAQSSTTQAFLNFGIAGASSITKGSLCLANKLSHKNHSRNFYPKPYIISNSPSEPLISFDTPQTHLPDHAMVDMEAFGFYQAALKFSSQEFIQVAKVISDNNAEDQNAITPNQVEQLIANHLATVIDIICMLHKKMQTLLMKPLPQYENLIKQYHFSEQERQQVHKLIHRACIFSIDIEDALQKITNKRELMIELSNRLSSEF